MSSAVRGYINNLAERCAAYSGPFASSPACLPFPAFGRDAREVEPQSLGGKCVRSSFFPCGKHRCLHNTHLCSGFFPLLHHFPETEGVTYFSFFKANDTYGSPRLFLLYGDVVIYNQMFTVCWLCFLPCRLLFLEKRVGRVLVHPGPLRDAETVRGQAGAHAHSYSG